MLRATLAITLVLIAIFFALVAHFLGPDLIKTRNENAIWYFLHITGGTVVLALGPIQFIAPIRNRFRRYHRAAGYTYLVASVMAFVGIIGLLPPKFDLFFPSQMTALILWLLCVVFAVRAARAGKFLSHQHNMARSFVLAAYFLTVRLVDRHGMWLLTPLVTSEPARMAHSDWVAWVIPLAVVEIYFSFKWQATLRGAKRPAGAA